MRCTPEAPEPPPSRAGRLAAPPSARGPLRVTTACGPSATGPCRGAPSSARGPLRVTTACGPLVVGRHAPPTVAPFAPLAITAEPNAAAPEPLPTRAGRLAAPPSRCRAQRRRPSGDLRQRDCEARPALQAGTDRRAAASVASRVRVVKRRNHAASRAHSRHHSPCAVCGRRAATHILPSAERTGVYCHEPSSGPSRQHRRPSHGAATTPATAAPASGAALGKRHPPPRFVALRSLLCPASAALFRCGLFAWIVPAFCSRLPLRMSRQKHLDRVPSQSTARDAPRRRTSDSKHSDDERAMHAKMRRVVQKTLPYMYGMCVSWVPVSDLRICSSLPSRCAAAERRA